MGVAHGVSGGGSPATELLCAVSGACEQAERASRRPAFWAERFEGLGNDVGQARSAACE